MNAQPAFEMKTSCSPIMILDLYRRLQHCVTGPARPWLWARSRRLRSTLTARQQQQRLQLHATPLALRHVAVDIILPMHATAPRLRHS